jgi:protein-disulfide isomerase
VQKHFNKNLRFVFRNFPLTQVHPEAESAAETAEFAGTHARFWRCMTVSTKTRSLLGLTLYLALIEALRLPENALSEVLEKRAFRPKVRGDFMGGLNSGVNGTPTFFINSRRHDAAFDFDDVVAAIGAKLVQLKVPGR